jgi:hypothetical protein
MSEGMARDRFGEALVALPVELAVREREDRAAQVLIVDGEGAQGLPGGVVCVVSGEAGDETLAAVRAAAEQGDAAGVATALEAYEERLERAGAKVAARQAEDSVVAAVSALPAITEVRYRGKAIAEGLVVHPELGSMCALVAYAGGGLDPESFVASTFVAPGQQVAVETVVVVREPQLTALERKVLERLPAEAGQLAIASAGGIADASLAGAGLALAAGVFLDRRPDELWSNMEQREAEAQAKFDQAQGKWEQKQGHLAWLAEDSELAGEIGQMAPGAAVQTLVQMRADLLLQDQLR